MLNINGIDNAVMIAQKALTRGRFLAPVAETPLHGLVTACLTIPKHEVGADYPVGDLVNVANDLVNASGTYDQKIQTMSDHDVMMERASVKVAGVMRENIQLIQNVVSPLVRKTLEEVNQALAGLEVAAIAVPIVEDSLCEFYFNDYFEDLILSASENTLRSELTPIHAIATLELSELVALAKTGIAGVDEDIERLIAVIGAEGIITGITYWLSKIKPRQMLSETERAMVDSRDMAVFIVLVCRSLLNGAAGDAQVPELLLDAVRDLMGQMSIRVRNDKARWEAAYEAGQLVISYPNRKEVNGSAGDKIVVHGELYNDWLAHGGTPEILYGAFFSDRAMMVSALDQGRERYNSQANAYLLDLRTANMAQTDAAIRSTIVNVVAQAAEEQGIQPSVDKSGVIVETKYRVLACLGHYARITQDEVVNIVTNVVCDSLFAETYAKFFIGLMNSYQRENPDAEPSTLANIATIDLLVRWVARSMTVEKD